MLLEKTLYRNAF